MMTDALEGWRKAGADFTHAVVLNVIDIMLRLDVIMMCCVASVRFAVVA